MSGNVARNAGDTAVNQRLANFYSKQTGLVNRTIAYLRIIFWTLFSIQVIAALMMFRKTKKNNKRYAPKPTPNLCFKKQFENTTPK